MANPCCQSPPREIAKFLALVCVAIASATLVYVCTQRREIAPWRRGAKQEIVAAGQTLKFDMSFMDYRSVCRKWLPHIDRTEGASDGEQMVEFRHSVCCQSPDTGRWQPFGVRNGGNYSTERTVSCLTAPEALRIPAPLARAALASGLRTIDLSDVDMLRKLTFVTGSSADHYAESLVLVKSLQKYFPDRGLVYWDLGLEKEQADNIKSLCGVTYKRFDASKYPSHVATLKTYAFKPLIIMETFEEYSLLWWVDSSVRFTSSYVRHVLRLAKERHGIVMFRDPVHSVWSTTYPQTYQYLATEEEGLKQAVTVTGASFLVANTKEVFSTILFWFYACALDQRCIAPIMYPEPCNVTDMDVFAGCHRFDQSVLTILAANIWGFDTDGYRFNQDMFKIRRSEAGDKKVFHCPKPVQS